MKHVCETNKEALTVFHSVTYKQTPPRHSHGSRVKRKESLQSRLRNWNSPYSAPSPHWQGCQFWPVSTEQKWASNVHKAHERFILHDWTKPWKYGCREKMKHQKIVEFLFLQAGLWGGQTKRRTFKSGKPPLMPASALGIEKTRFYFVSFVAYLEFRILIFWKCFEMKMPRRTR